MSLLVAIIWECLYLSKAMLLDDVLLLVSTIAVGIYFLLLHFSEDTAERWFTIIRRLGLTDQLDFPIYYISRSLWLCFVVNTFCYLTERGLFEKDMFRRKAMRKQQLQQKPVIKLVLSRTLKLKPVDQVVDAAFKPIQT
ncbi:hypothetical protein B0J14DRAFT_652081 [Halenospora varia]|nr:hypothetical protein B0J14DRAFT_652081 [Halenospora varia]